MQDFMMMASEMSTLSLASTSEVEPEEVPIEDPVPSRGASRKHYNMLCHVCQDTIERGVGSWKQAVAAGSTFDPYHKHHRSLKSLWESLFTDCYVCNTFCERISPWARALILERLDTRSALGWDVELGEGDWGPLVTGIEVRPSGYDKAASSYWLTVRLEEDHINFQSPVSDDKAQDIEVHLILDGKIPSYLLETTGSHGSSQSKRGPSETCRHEPRPSHQHSQPRHLFSRQAMDLELR